MSTLSWLHDPGLRAHAVGLTINLFLTIAKFVVGWIAASEALTADGFNSAGDIFATAVGFAGYAYSKKPADDDHHYGHGNAESIAGLVIGTVLAATGIFIAIEGLLAWIAGKTEPPGSLALWVAAITVVSKEALYRYAHAVGSRLRSPSLLASARDHRGDVLVASTVFAGIFTARLGVPALDPIAACGIGLYISWFAIEPIRSNVGILMDQAPPDLKDSFERLVLEDEDVRRVDQLRVHPVGARFVVDLEIYVDGEISLRDAHEIAHRVEDRIQAARDDIDSVHVHVNPDP
ncbi:MAG: cation transporter [Planctomycetes bacterium]|nr:cation transporter [Planctomycetota bacterium]